MATEVKFTYLVCKKGKVEIMTLDEAIQKINGYKGARIEAKVPGPVSEYVGVPYRV